MTAKKTNFLIATYLNERTAKSLANLMMIVCYFLIFFFAFGAVLSMMGRQQVILHTSSGTYNNAIYAEDNHEPTSRWLTVTMTEEVRVIADKDIDLATHIGLSSMYLINVVPAIFSFWFLGRVFKNISNSVIFTEQNAKYLLYYGIIQILSAIAVPFIKLFVSYLTGLFTSNRISISAGQDIIADIVPNIAFIVAAYIIHYGIHLQDEADHTL